MADSISEILELSKSETGRCQMKEDGSLDVICDAIMSQSSSSSVSAARALRNSCAGNEENASYLSKLKVIEWIAKYCREIALMKMTPDDSDEPFGGKPDVNMRDGNQQDKDNFLLALCQFLSNFGGCGEESALFLWSSSFGENGESSKYIDLNLLPQRTV